MKDQPPKLCDASYFSSIPSGINQIHIKQLHPLIYPA